MRLNRVLLLAATINIVIFALLFTISCSGDDGKPGKDGKNCTAESNGEGGFNVICGDENIGILEGPADHKGKDGPDGANGPDGAPGSYCVLGGGSTASSILQITCSGTVSGALTLDACTATSLTDNHTVIACGKTTEINVCSYISAGDRTAQIFDPTTNACESDGVSGGGINGVCQDGTKYKKSTEYCGYKAKLSTKRTALKKCNTRDPETTGSYADEYLSGYHPNQGTYYIGEDYEEYQTAARCLAANGEPIYSTSSDLYPYEKYQGCVVNEWQNQYCQWIGPISAAGNPRTVDDRDNNEALEIFVARCAGKTLNEGSWKGEYCAYLEAPKSNQIRAVKTGLCDDFIYADPERGFGPDEVAYGFAYCAVPYSAFKDDEGGTPRLYDRYNGKTIYVDKLDKTNGSSARLCGPDLSKKPNNGKWNGDYCGYKAPTAADPATDKEDSVMYAKAICDDGHGPQEAGYDKYNYCRVYQEGIAWFDDGRDSTAFSQGDCEGTDSKGESTFKMPNKGKWYGEYCYWGKTSDGADKMGKGICDDGGGPSDGGYSTTEYCRAYRNEAGLFKTAKVEDVCDNGQRVNEGGWKTEYCGYADADSEEKSRLLGGCGDEKGPNSESFGGGYCTAPSKTELVVYTSTFCGEDGKPNEGEWKGEYCGYESENSTSPDKVYAGVCDDNRGPNQDGFNMGYCRWQEGATGTTLETDEYCGGATLNEGSWKGEYCFADDKVAVCTGGRIPNAEKNSTDPFTVRCIFPPTELQCTDTNLKACDKDGCEDLGDGFEWDAEAFECRAATTEED